MKKLISKNDALNKYVCLLGIMTIIMVLSVLMLKFYPYNQSQLVQSRVLKQDGQSLVLRELKTNKTFMYNTYNDKQYKVNSITTFSLSPRNYINNRESERLLNNLQNISLIMFFGFISIGFLTYHEYRNKYNL